MKLQPTVLLAMSAVLASAQVKHGTIGMGIHMYLPWCCTACSDTLSPLYLNCTTFDADSHDSHGGMKKRMMGMGSATGTTSADCRASDEPWLQTLSYCIKTHCDAEGVGAEQQERCWQKNAAEGMPVPKLQDELPLVVPTVAVAEDAEWLNETMLVNDDKWTIDRGTIMEFEKSEEDHALFSIIVMIVTIAFPLIAGIYLLLTSSRKSSIFNATRAYLTLPAVFNGRQSEPLPYKLGYLPSRSNSVIIVIYILLNVVFNCVRFRSVQPSSWFSNRDQEMAAYIGNRAGVLSFANMALAMLFSTRNNPLSWVSGWTPTTFITLHRWAARVSVVQAIVHSVAYTADYVAYMDPPMFTEEAKLPYFWWGIIATTAMGLMAALSVLPLRKAAYELFLVLHILLAIISLMGCWYHVDIRFKQRWGYEVWLYLAFAFWAYDRLLRFGRLVFYSFLGGTSHGQLERIPGVENVVALKLYPARTFSAAPGQHTFVYFPSLGRFWENHPFTIAGWGIDRAVEDDNSAASEQSSLDGKGSDKNVQVSTRAIANPLYIDQFYVTCLFRTHTGTTHQLQKILASKSPSTILCEGPYGGHSPATRSVLRNADQVLVVAGGIGITFAAAYAKQFAGELSESASSQLTPKCQRFIVAWTVREEGLLEYAKRELLPEAKTGDRSLEYSFHVTGEAVDGCEKAERRMDVAAAVNGIVSKNQKVVVLVCGPGGLADDVRREVVRCNKIGYDVELLEESFAW